MKPDLSSLRVMEVATAISVPLIGEVLANLGADVLKIESLQRLDGNRVRASRKGETGASGMNLDESAPLWHEFNSGKRSVTLNLKTDVGRELFLQLIGKADVFIQNFAPGWLERIDLGGEKLLEVNPRLIMLLASGYGQDGPLAQQRVYAPVMTALGGQEALIGPSSGDVVGAMALAFGDFNAAHFGLPLLFGALYERETTGRGCIIDLAQVAAVTSTLGEPLIEYQLTGQLPTPVGANSPYRAPHGVFPCKGDDAWATLSIAIDSEWSALARLVASTAPDLQEAVLDKRWQTTGARLAGSEALASLLSRWTSRFEPKELADLVQNAGLRCAPVQFPDRMERDPHFEARRFTTVVQHPRVGPLEVTSTPWLFDGDTPTPRVAGPALGEATEAVLTGLLGLTHEQVEAYAREGYLA